MNTAGGRVTLKDIALALGVSINTVHKAINGKPGVGDELRKRIIAYASEHGYRRNVSAASLRRRDVRVLVCLPDTAGDGRYFYAYAWQGCRRYIDEVQDTGAIFELVEFKTGTYAERLEAILKRVKDGGDINGLLAVAPESLPDAKLLRAISEEDVPVMLLNGDDASTGRIGAVVASYDAAGELMAEQAANLLRNIVGERRVLLLAGDPYIESHYRVARAFHVHLAEQMPGVAIEDVVGAHAHAARLRTELVDSLRSASGFSLACSVFAAGSEVLGDALIETGLVGKIPAIGSDLFPGSVEALRRGIFTNVVYKNPVGLAYDALQALGEYVLWGTRPGEEVEVGPIDLVFRSNLDDYCRRSGLS